MSNKYLVVQGTNIVKDFPPIITSAFDGVESDIDTEKARINAIELKRLLEQGTPTDLISTPTYDGDVLTQIVWANTSVVTIRTDTFAYTEDIGAGTETTTEVRTLNTGETLTIVTSFNSADGRILGRTSTLVLV